MMLAVFMILGTVSTWALTADLSMNYELAGYKAKAFYDLTSNDASLMPTEGDLRYRADYGLFNFGSGSRSADINIPVTETDLLVCQFADTQKRGVTINTISACTKSTTLNDGSHLFFEVNTSVENLNINIGRGGCVVSILVMEKDNEAITADYTLNYMYEGSPVKTVTASGAVGATVLTDASFFADDVKYFRADGQPESFTVAASDNTFNVNVRLAATYNYTLENSLGGTITSGSYFEGETVYAPYPRYQLKDGAFYEAAVTNKEYRKPIALTADNASATVEYAAKDGANAVFFAEAESLEGVTNSTFGNIPVRASNALAATAEGDVKVTTLAPGKYKFHIGVFTSKGAYADFFLKFAIGADSLTATLANVNLNEFASEEFTLTKMTAVTFSGANSSADAQFDYIWIEKTGDMPFDPATAIVNAGFNPEADPLGWDKVTSAQFYDLGMGLIGTYQVRGEHPAATVDETHLATEFAAGLECRWSTNYAAFTQTTAELPAGAYKLTFDVENTNATTTKANYENRFNVTVGENVYNDESTEWMDGKSAWTTHTIAFTLTEASPITISLGYGTGSNNFGVGNTPALFVSHLTLEAINSIEIALIDLQAAIEAAQAKAATYTVGTEFFTYAESEIKPLNDAIATAQAAYTAAESAEAVKSATETLNAFVATFAPVMNKPAADKAYTFELRLGGETPLYMALAEGGITIAEEATPLKFVAVEGAEGQYNLTNEDGTLFVGLAGGNAWTMSTLAEKKAAWSFTALPDGAYRINNLVTVGRFVGTNAAEKAAGSVCYADKQTSNGNVDWLIAEYVAPEPVKTDYTDYIANADLTGEGGFDATGTKGIDGSGIVKVGNAAAFDFKQTIENLPAGKYKVTAQAAYRYGGDEQAEYNAMQTENTITKFVQLYATVGTTTVDTLVQNRYDGASETNLFNGEGGVSVVNEKFVPNSSDAVKAWFAAGKYVNEVEFNLPADGAVTIGINRISTPESDYTVIGPWTLTRLGDAEVEPEPEPEHFFADGKYYIYNNGTKNYLAAGADWGTHAVVNATGLDYTLTQADGKYTMDSQISNGGNNHFLNGEWNDGAAMGWTFAAVEGKEGVYTISNGEKFLTAGENSLVTLADDATAEAAQWSLKTLEARIAELATATAEAPVNATFLIQDANFGRNDLRKSAWTIEASNQNLSGGNNTNNNAESYHSVFTLSQVLTNVPKGVYTLTAQGFYRQDGSDNENLPVFFANDYTQTFPLKTGSENSMSEASASFSNGNYTIDPIYFQLTEAGDLTVGAKLENNANLWCIWDNFQLTYYGADADLEAVKNAAIIKELADLRAKAEALKAEVEVDAVKTAIDEALGATAEVSGADAINTAIATMKAVIEKADVHIAAKAALDAMANVMAGTNVYTAEAFETYNGIYETAKGKYQAGELTKDDVIENPEVLGWHTPNNVDDLLLSAWSIGADKAKDYDKALYINTWSVEGNNDGSNFKTPFFEYWTGDGESLGENKLTATMSNLEPGTYDVTAWVRVRAKNGYTAPAYGISLQANDGEAVNVADGAQVGTSQFYLKEVTATGTVAEDGALNITFNVAADNNISWLSFKNVKFEKKTTAEDIALGNAIDALKAIIAADKSIETEGQQGAEALATAISTAETAANAGNATLESIAAARAALAKAVSEFVKANINDNFSEIAQDQGKTLDTFERTTLVVGEDYSTYTASADLQVAYKMFDIDVKDCDYLVVKFAEPLAAGWSIAFWSKTGNKSVEIPAGATEYKYVFADDAECAIANDVLPQICMLTLWGAQKPLVANVVGIYKHQVPGEPTGISTMKGNDFQNGVIYNLNGQKLQKAQRGLYIINGKKVVVK